MLCLYEAAEAIPKSVCLAALRGGDRIIEVLFVFKMRAIYIYLYISIYILVLS